MAILTAILSSFVTKWAGDLQLKKHIELYPFVIEQKLDSSPQLAQIIADKGYLQHQSDIKQLASDMLQLGGIFRVKIWDTEQTVIWSDDPSIIGKEFPRGDLYAKAILGSSEYEVTTPTRDEQATEASAKQVLEIYVPILYHQKVVGAFEIYEATETLFEEIRSNTITIWIISILTGIVFYLLLFGIFYRSYRKQKEANESLMKTQEVTILALAAVAETRDQETGQHILRTQRYVELLAEHLRTDPKFKRYLSTERIQELTRSSPLHDIGKVGISDSILNKPGKLTADEFEIMRQHPRFGYEALNIAVDRLGSTSFLETARELILTHHEKWDGTGYPEGLSGESIPLSGRLMALADVYDALVSKRVYKGAFTHDEAKAIILEGSGKHFDPAVVEAFLKLEQDFIEIAEGMRDI